jgi:hypothetical protein
MCIRYCGGICPTVDLACVGSTVGLTIVGEAHSPRIKSVLNEGESQACAGPKFGGMGGVEKISEEESDELEEKGYEDVEAKY